METILASEPNDLGARALDAREQFNGVLLRADDQGPAGSRGCNREFAHATKYSLTWNVVRPAMKCPACCSEVDNRSYRCRKCRGICSYRRLCWRYRYLVCGIAALIGFWTIKGYVRRWYATDYDKLPEGALVSDATTLSWLALRDKGWFCAEP